MGPAVWVPAVIGAAGLYQANQQANASRHAQQDALKASKEANAPITEALQNMLNLAKTHDFHADTLNAANAAEAIATPTLEQALQNLNANYRAGGGVPGNSSEWNVKSVETARRVIDPMKQWVADQYMNEFGRKMAAFQAVNGGNTGNLSSDYWKYASSLPQPNYSGSMVFLNQALNGLFNRTGGAGGTGDARTNLYPNNSPYSNPPAGSHYEQDGSGNWIAVPDGGS